MKLVFATTNVGKLAELRELVTGLEVISAAEAAPGLEVEEDALTFEGNAEKKARAFLAATGLPSLADDSGLCVDALGGRPGVWSARYAPTDAERIAKLLGELKGAQNRKAHFTCALCLALPGGAIERAVGECHGEIIDGPRGAHGFGYDPVFFVPSLGKTLAELTRPEKAGLSHRGQAMRAMAPKLAR
ncbi:MAG: RdgB/HAM1 family non-canonical purine NTP pyrophosphatase [Myxococcaceae bacterium]|nr:RdgB/HAM1 family non-canonical purine NTP pyrophosphatase [Myxococcaceae bacterium]